MPSYHHTRPPVTVVHPWSQHRFLSRHSSVITPSEQQPPERQHHVMLISLGDGGGHMGHGWTASFTQALSPTIIVCACVCVCVCVCVCPPGAGDVCYLSLHTFLPAIDHVSVNTLRPQSNQVKVNTPHLGGGVTQTHSLSMHTYGLLTCIRRLWVGVESVDL